MCDITEKIDDAASDIVCVGLEIGVLIKEQRRDRIALAFFDKIMSGTDLKNNLRRCYEFADEFLASKKEDEE